MTPCKPIVIIDDDADDIMIFNMALTELGLEIPVLQFATVKDAYKYLLESDEPPGLIISDMHLPAHDGLELRKLLRGHDRFNTTAVPFIVLSTGFSAEEIDQALALEIHGLFIKEASFALYIEKMECILKYWSCSVFSNRAETAQPWIGLKQTK